MKAVKRKLKKTKAYQWVAFCRHALYHGPVIAKRLYYQQLKTIRISGEQAGEKDSGVQRMNLRKKRHFSHTVLFSVIVPVNMPDRKLLPEMVRSLVRQTYDGWGLYLFPQDPDLSREDEDFLRSIAATDSRIHYISVGNAALDEKNSFKRWLKTAPGHFFIRMKQEDTLHPSALRKIMEVICDRQADLIYADDCICQENHPEAQNKRYKPDYAPDSLRGTPYLGDLLVFSRELATRCAKECPHVPEPINDYEIMYLLTERAVQICHIPQVLSDCRKKDGIHALLDENQIDIAKQALDRHLARIGLHGYATDSYVPGTFHIHFAVRGEPLVSILIPNRDHSDDLRKCVLSILEQTSWKNYEILIIENGSRENATEELYRELTENRKIRLLRWEQDPFNYSAINNYAARMAKGEYLLLLNNDTEVLSADWIQEMLMYAQRPDVGAVGAKLYYPDGTIQHAGIGIGLMDSVGHFHRRFPGKAAGYMGRLAYAQNLSAVTGACMMIPKTVYDEMMGMDESFPLVFNDVDFCLKLRRKGYMIVWTPFAELMHYESKTRGADLSSPESKQFFQKESRRFQIKWNMELTEGDPYYNPNLTLKREDFSSRGKDLD